MRSRDRNIKAVDMDMESGGIMLPAHSRVEPAHTLILRGISDLADERKQKMDELGHTRMIQQYSLVFARSVKYLNQRNKKKVSMVCMWISAPDRK